MIECFSSKAIFCELNDLNDVIKWEMRKFCLAINPIYLEEDYHNFYLPLNQKNIYNLRLLKDEFSSEIIMASFEESWDYFKFNKFIVSKEDAKVLFERLLNNHEDLKLINMELKDKYFGKNNIDNTLQTDLNDYFK